MRVGVAKEIGAGETRVALVPEGITKLTAQKIEVLVEVDAGAGASISDARFEAAGARIVDAATLYEAADVILRVQPPSHKEAGRLRAGAVLAGFLAPFVDWKLAQLLAERSVTSFSMELVPRITRAQPMDALSAMSTIAGYRAVLIAALELPKFFPMLVTAAGTLVPAKVLVLGAGVAGLQAIASARRLGAVVTAFDVRPVVKEQVESLGAKFLAVEITENTQDAGGYAKALSESAEKRVADLLARSVPTFDVVITTALIPGKRAPLLVPAAVVRAMQPGAVIIDLAAEAGGNCELTRAGERVLDSGVTILGPVNLPASMPVHASLMYSKVIASFLQLLVRDASLHLNWDDEIVQGACLTHAGSIVHKGVRDLVDTRVGEQTAG